MPKLLTVSDTPEEALQKLDEATKTFGGRAEITRSAARFTEFMSLGVSKAGAIKILADKLGIDNAEILAIGDSDNDLQMITSVGCGVAMGNAEDEVKAEANIVCAPVWEDGVAQIIEAWLAEGKIGRM